MKKLNLLAIIFLMMTLVSCGLAQRSAFEYQQQISLASQKSSADLKERVKMFIEETENDPEVEFAKVRYYKEGYWEPIYYADVFCNVKYIDSSLSGVMLRSINKQAVNKKTEDH
ncbi:MAG: hypothetical protein ACI9S8_001328 [Chlamydiales bacterium]|jgi:hypothetical protein